MDQLQAFAEANHLSFAEGAWTGVYADMFVSLMRRDGSVEMHVCADLPRGAKRVQLINGLREKQERCQATVKESANAQVLVFAFADDGSAVQRMERFVSECDVLLRPYTREMGILCGKCRREIHAEEQFEVQTVEGEPMPVCSACARGETTRGVNRRVETQRRTRRGVLGALIGTLACTALYAVLDAMGLTGIWLPALAVGFVLNRFYQRFGGIDDKWSMYLLSLCAVFSVILGTLVASAGATTMALLRYADELEGAVSAGEAFRSGLEVAKLYFTAPSIWMYSILPHAAIAVVSVFVFRNR